MKVPGHKSPKGVYWRGNSCWIRYPFRGDKQREPADVQLDDGATRLPEAELLKRVLKVEAAAVKKRDARLIEIGAAKRGGPAFAGPAQEKLTVDDLIDAEVTHLKLKGAKGLRPFECHMKPVREFFGMMRAVDVTTAKVEKYAQGRLETRAIATVNQEIGGLRMALNLAQRQGRLARAPYISLLGGANVRKGFFGTAREFEAHNGFLPDPVNDIARFGYLVGWRKGEVTPLRWEFVDRKAREIRLPDSKNGEGRVLPLEGPLWDLIEKRWVLREWKDADKVTHVSEFVFHRRGRPLQEFRKTWAAACKKAKLPGRLFHDFRRTAARDMIRAGVPETVAMQITGHKTRSMLDRYNITSVDDMKAAVRRTQRHRAIQSKRDVVVDFPAAKSARGGRR